jgi:hypothetical protein
MIGVGLISIMFQGFISMSTLGGENLTETIIGAVTRGTISGSQTGNFNRTGRAGIATDIGKGKKAGASRAINLGRNESNRQ